MYKGVNSAWIPRRRPDRIILRASTARVRVIEIRVIVVSLCGETVRVARVHIIGLIVNAP